ncbi:MAG: hypothetical protein GX800_08330, partial [Clostridiaceae bacterium]|nr:hypothetical protein [Clostridiaceae bacterium]
MKHLLNILLILLIWNCVFSQSQNQNYIKTTKFINDSNATVEIIQYYDGLGRPIQTVQKGITPNHADLVSYTEYDDVGREWKNHLPIIGTGNGSYVPLSNFSGSNIYDGESRAYSEILYEHSPLNRVIGNKGPGSAWQNNPTSIMYEANNNEVRYYYVNESGELKSNSNYPPSSLYKTTTKDEDNKSITEYKDKLGRIVMQRHGTNVDTYYVYNDLGQLSYVLPPLAADANGSEDAINKYGYVYKYDERGNCIYKKLPGCEYIRMAYDKANRMIISQDGNQRKKGKVLITRYDIFGRIAYVHVSHYFPNTNILNLLKTVVVTEEYNGTGLTGYTEKNHGVPMRIEQLLTVNYYDNYQFVTNDSLKYTQKTGYSKGYTDKQGVQNPVHADLNAKGMLTGTRTYQLDNLNNYTTDVYYYDNKGNLVQQRSTNHLGGYDFVYNDLDFNGKPNKTLRIHTSQGSPPDYPFGEWSPENISELYTYYYDHAGRILKTTYKLNNGTTITLSDLTNGGYDELGRLISKKRHNGTDTESFEYNIRNQPTKIQSGTFVQNLYYTSNPTGGVVRCYNGNIAQTNWTYGNTVNYYSYTYDELNRLEEAVFENLDIGADKTEMFIYDKNGNTIHIARLRDNDYMDMLEIDYNGNQIKKITDIDGDQGLYNVKEYRDLADKDIEFYYDANGNLVTDLDRDIVTIRYNILNLPELIQFKNGYQILNKYDAAGKKLSSQNIIIATPVVVPIGEINTTYDPDPCSIYHWGAEYVGNIEYAFENDCDFQVRSLDKIYNSEGYVVNVTTNPKYCYYRRDHLGNNREVWVGGNNSTIQHTQYYATGLPWA